MMACQMHTILLTNRWRRGPSAVAAADGLCVGVEGVQEFVLASGVQSTAPAAVTASSSGG